MLTDSGQSGVIVADSAGRPLHLSPEGRRLLFLATYPHAAPGASISRVPALPPALVRICRNLSRATSADAFASAPVHHHRNVWGGFRFLSHTSVSGDSDGREAHVVQCRRHAPRMTAPGRSERYRKMPQVHPKPT